MKNTFTKEERLCSKRLIESLFHKGSSFVVYPYRVVFLPHELGDSTFGMQSILSVSKRRFKRAVDRNFLKRRMREAFRLKKAEALYPFLESYGLNMLLAFQYIGKEPVPFEIMCQRMDDTLLKLKHEITKLHLDKTD